LPSITYVRKEMVERRMGARAQMRKNMSELRRAGFVLSLSVCSRGKKNGKLDIRRTRPGMDIHTRRRQGRRKITKIRTSKPRTLDHPPHLYLPRVQRALDPALLPREELDELDLQAQNQPSVVKDPGTPR